MAAGLVLPISGPYVATYATHVMGVMNDDGYVLQVTVQGQEVSETDAYGLTLVEAIYRGANWRCRIRGIEWNRPGLMDALQIFGQSGASGTFNPTLATVGDRWTKYAQTLLLSSVLGNPPSTPITLTALSAAIAPQSTTEFMLTSKVREMPIEFVFIPYITLITPNPNVWFTVT